MKGKRVRMQTKGQITLPADIRRAFKEGTEFDVVRRPNGEIVFRPIHTIEINPDQAWFFEEPWQAKERQVERHLAAGETTTYESGQDFLDSLAE